MRPPDESHFSHFAASALWSLPRPSRPLNHSSAVPAPISLTELNSSLSSSTSDARKNLVSLRLLGGWAFSSVLADTAWSSCVEKMNGNAGIIADGTDDEMRRSTSYGQSERLECLIKEQWACNLRSA